MCSVSEDIVNESLLENSLNTEKKCDTTCRKCTTEKASVVLQRKFSYCKLCFLHLVNHKFRATIGKLKLKHMRDNILVVFSGDQSSTALLHLLQSGMNESNHKKLRFRVYILVIDDSVLWPKSTDILPTMSSILNVSKEFPFKRYIVKLSNIYKKPEVREFEGLSASDEYDSKLVRLFAGVKNSTSKIDLLSQLRSRISYECATLLDCNKIFTSECATDVAVRILADTSLGRFNHISYDSAICDTRNPSVHHIRPLRELTAKEISFYNIFNELNFVVLPSPTAMFSYNPSLQWETLTFISNLQEEFPSTVYTVFNVGDKLRKTEATTESSCALCGISFEATSDYSSGKRVVSSNSISNDSTNEITLKFQFCFACQHVIDDMDTTDNLPLVAT